MESNTRASLLVRIREASDRQAWDQFIEIYGPIVFHFGKRIGLQEADAADLVQEVLQEVTKSIARFDYDPNIGKFRSWLFKVAKRAASRMRSKSSKLPMTAPSAGAEDLLHSVQDEFDNEEVWEAEYRKKLFEWAAAQIKSKYQTATWQAFWMTAVEGHDSNEVADKLGLSVGSVYVAKNRITKRLAEKIREVDDSN